MKINHKIFKNLNNPLDVQDVDGRQVEIHIMNETAYFATYVNRGQYALWTSDGKNYKLLIEEGYYEEFKEIFTPEMNLAWIDYFEKLVKTRRRVSRAFWYPALIIIALVFLSVLLLPQFDNIVPQAILSFIEANSTYVLFGSLILLILMSVLNSSVFKRRAEKIQNEHVIRINEILGAERSHELALQQDTYHKRYLAQFDEEVIEEPVAEEVIEEEVIIPVFEVEEEEIIIEEEVVELVEEPVEVEPEPEFIPLIEEVVEEPPVEEEKVLLEELSLLKVDQLREFAKNRKISHYSSMNKTELIESLPSILEELIVVELKTIAKAKNINNFSVMTKPELIYNIRNYVEEEIIEEPVAEEPVVEPVVEVEPEPVIEKPVVVVEKEVVEEDKEPLEVLRILKVDQLREFVKERNIPNYSKMNKTELIAELPYELEKLLVVELREVVKALEISNYSIMTKPQLIEAIVNGPQEEVVEQPVVEPVIEVKPEPVVKKVKEEKKEEVETDLLDELFILKVDELREFVKNRNISNYSVMNKTELIGVLPSSLEQLRVTELKAIARAKDLTNYSQLNKPQLVELILNGEVEEKPVAALVVEVEPEPIIEEEVVEELVIEEEVAEEDKEPLEMLQILTVDVLREFVKNRKIANYSKMNKTDLINNLPSTLEELTVPELKQLAKANEHSNYSVMNKPQLIDLLTGKPVAKEEAKEIDLSILTVPELREFAKARKVVNFGLMNKPQLIDELPKEMEELRVEELKAVARKLEIRNFSVMIKGELIVAIKEQLDK